MKNEKITYACELYPSEFSTLNDKPIVLKEKGIIRWHIALFNPKYDKFKVVHALEKAFSKWQRGFDLIEPVGRYITFESTPYFDKADIKIFFAPQFHHRVEMQINTTSGKIPYVLNCPFEFDGPENVLAHARPLNDNFQAGHIHFDNDEDPTKYKIMTVGFHEIGHALLLGHSKERKAIMFGEYTEDKENLHNDDIKGISHIWSDYKRVIYKDTEQFKNDQLIKEQLSEEKNREIIHNYLNSSEYARRLEAQINNYINSQNFLCRLFCK